MEGLALTGAWVDKEQGLLSTIVLEMGGSSDLCALLQPGEPVILMGPTGTPTETPGGETVLLVGGGRQFRITNARAGDPSGSRALRSYSAATAWRAPRRRSERSTQSFVSFSWTPFWPSRARSEPKSTRSRL